MTLDPRLQTQEGIPFTGPPNLVDPTHYAVELRNLDVMKVTSIKSYGLAPSIQTYLSRLLLPFLK